MANESIENILWSLWRQDDIGNKFPVKEGISKSDAEKLLNEYISKGHKQTYWIETYDKYETG